MVVEVVELISALFLFGLIILVSPLIRFRFHVLPVDEIGPLFGDPHFYLWNKTRKVGSRSRVHDVFVFHPDMFVSNQLVVKKWKSKLCVTDSSVVVKTQAIFFKLKIFRHLVRKGIDYPDRFSDLPSRSFKVEIPLDAEEERSAIANLKSLGFDAERKFVALIVRDGAYKARYRRAPLPTDVKEAYRNHLIGDFAMLPEISERNGVHMVRMGVAVEEKFSTSNNTLFDYASTGARDEVTDLFLLTRCELAVSTSVGLDTVCAIAGIPRLAVNIAPYRVLASFYPWETVLPVRYRLKGTLGTLGLGESLKLDSVQNFRGSEELQRQGLEIVRATPQDLAEAYGDALARAQTGDHLSAADETLQREFWKVLERSLNLRPSTSHPRPRVAPSFLRRYSEWLYG